MGYMHIENLYKNQKILEFSHCYAVEKIHGTSAHVSFTRTSGQLNFSSGGEKHTNFIALFDQADLQRRFLGLRGDKIVVFGEAYGPSQHKQGWRYGDKLRFTVFEVCIDGEWLSVPKAEAYAQLLNLEFAHYTLIETKLSAIDAERDATSEAARRVGVQGFIRREGVVLRTLNEELDHHGNRILAKHKRAEERETKTDRPVDASKVAVLKEARAIAEEWVTPTRLQHVLDKLPEATDMTATRAVISAMIEDVEREAKDEIVPSQTARAEIGKRTAQLFKQHLVNRLKDVDT